MAGAARDQRDLCQTFHWQRLTAFAGEPVFWEDGDQWVGEEFLGDEPFWVRCC
jgi:hypothetical protein